MAPSSASMPAPAIPIFRIPLFKAGINSSLLLHNNDKIIAIYGTPYEPGQMVGLKIPHVTPANSSAPGDRATRRRGIVEQ